MKINERNCQASFAVSSTASFSTEVKSTNSMMETDARSLITKTSLDDSGISSIPINVSWSNVMYKTVNTESL